MPYVWTETPATFEADYAWSWLGYGQVFIVDRGDGPVVIYPTTVLIRRSA